MTRSSQRFFPVGDGLRSLAIALLPLLVLVVGSLARAQTPDNGPAAAQPQPRERPQSLHRPLSVADQLDRLNGQLHLTAEQQAKVKVILDRRQAQIQQLRSSQPLTAMDRFMKIDAVKRDALDKINDLLTDEQRKIFRPSGPTPTDVRKKLHASETASAGHD